MDISCSTYSIVACDLEEQMWGVAVASKFLAVGALVCWAQAGVGAIATQALVRVSFGPVGLNLLTQGATASEALMTLLNSDPHPANRQIGIVDASGRVAVHTGDHCSMWAGHVMGEGFCCQGNILKGPETLSKMAEIFINTKGTLADRLILALSAGDHTGGDRRGKQSAAILVVCPNSGYGGDTDRFIDLRVDDDPEPVTKLRNLVSKHLVFFGKPQPEDLIKIDESLARELQVMLKKHHYYDGEIHGIWDEESKISFWRMIRTENLEERWNIDRQPHLLDKVVLGYLRKNLVA